MALTDVKVRNAKPRVKQFKLSDGDGMYLLITPNGSKYWRLKYRSNGKEKLLALGTYPEVSLSEARDKRSVARKHLANGIDPSEVKKAKKAATVSEAENSFEVVAREWHSKFTPTWTTGHADTIMSRMERDLFPWLGAKPIGEIKAPELLAALRRVESRGALETAHRVRTIAGQVFRYAVATGRAERDPAADLRGALPPTTVKHFSAITDPKDIVHLLRAIEGYKGTLVVRQALRLAPLVFLRPGELRKAEWSEFDLEAAEWNIPVERMKLGKKVKAAQKGQKHLVPLSAQAVAILKELEPLTGKSRYVFPCARSLARPMSENAVNAALRRMGFSGEEMCGHGFRATARTMIRQELHLDAEYIELQLAHATKSPNGAAYDRVSFLPERRRMMQQWADYLDGLKNGAKVLPFKKVGQE